MAKIEELQREIENLEIRLSNTDDNVERLRDMLVRLVGVVQSVLAEVREIQRHEALKPRSGNNKA